MPAPVMIEMRYQGIGNAKYDIDSILLPALLCTSTWICHHTSPNTQQFMLRVINQAQFSRLNTVIDFTVSVFGCHIVNEHLVKPLVGKNISMRCSIQFSNINIALLLPVPNVL